MNNLYHNYDFHCQMLYLVRILAIYAQCELNLLLFRQNNNDCWRKGKYFLFSPVKESIL